MLQQGVILPSMSIWSLPPILLKRKKDDPERFGVDYLGLNKIATPDSHPLPKIDEITNSLSGKTCLLFSIKELQTGPFLFTLRTAQSRLLQMGIVSISSDVFYSDCQQHRGL